MAATIRVVVVVVVVVIIIMIIIRRRETASEWKRKRAGRHKRRRTKRGARRARGPDATVSSRLGTRTINQFGLPMFILDSEPVSESALPTRLARTRAK